MLIIKELKIFGTTKEKRKFSGEISFTSGLNLINTENGFGKSLIYTGLIWCLGLEAYLGKSANDNSVWSDGVLDKVKLDGGQTGEVNESFASLTFEDKDKRLITLTRAVENGNPSIVECLIQQNGKFEKINLKTAEFQNENISLTRNIFTWAGISVQKSFNRKNESQVYFENLASMFFINQKGGWVELFCDQVRKYGLIEIDPLVVEHILGLESYKEKRLADIEYDLLSSSYRQELISILSEINIQVRKFDDRGLAYGSKTLEDLVDQFKEFKIFNYLEKEFNHSFKREILNLREGQKRIHDEMDLTEENNLELSNREELREVRNAILTLKSDLSKIQNKIESAELKIIDDKLLLKDLNSKVQIYENLRYLKKDNVGLLTGDYECPTCMQHIDSRTYDITNLTLNEVDLSLRLKKSERKALESSLEKTLKSFKELKTTKDSIISEIEENSLKFNLLDRTLSENKKLFVRSALDLGSLESKIQRVQDSANHIESLQLQLDSSIKKIVENRTRKELKLSKEEEKRIVKFEEELVRMFGKIKLTAFKESNNEMNYKKIGISVDNDYKPFLDGKELRRYCSASDQSKIILAYLIALQITSLQFQGANHLGVTVFDEPFQQNPEEKYTESTLDFLTKISSSLTGQSIILTHLKKEHEGEASHIEGYNKIVRERFLKYVDKAVLK